MRNQSCTVAGHVIGADPERAASALGVEVELFYNRQHPSEMFFPDTRRPAASSIFETAGKEDNAVKLQTHRGQGALERCL